MLLRICGLLVLSLFPVYGFGQLYEIKQNHQWGLINQQGEVVLQPRYDYVEAAPSRSHFFIYRNGQAGVFHQSRGLISTPAFDHIFSQKHGYYLIASQGKYGIMDTLGKLISPPAFDQIRQEGIHFYTKNERKMGLIQPLLGEIIPTRYDSIFRFDLLHYAIIDSGKMGLTDTLGKVVEAPAYRQITHLYGEWYAYQQGRWWGVKPLRADTFLLEPVFDRIHPFDQGEMLMQTRTGNLGALYNFRGEKLLDSVPVLLKRRLTANYVYAKGRGEGLTDSSGKPLTPAAFESIEDWEGGYLLVKRNNRQGVLTRQGKLLVPMQYARVRMDSTRRFWVRGRRLWGIHGREGQLLAAPRFLTAGDFQNNVARVAVMGYDTLWLSPSPLAPVPQLPQQVRVPKYGIINQYGEYLAEPIYDEVKVFMGVALLTLNGKTTQIGFDQEGRPSQKRKLIVARSIDEYENEFELQRAQMDTTSYFREEVARSPDTLSWLKIEGYWGLRRKNGAHSSWAIGPRYEAVTPIEGTSLSLVAEESDRPGLDLLYGLVDHDNGYVLTGSRFKKVFTEDLATSGYLRVLDYNGYYHILDQEGNSTLKRKKSWTAHKLRNGPTFLGAIHHDMLRVCFEGVRLGTQELTPAQRETRLLEGGGKWGLMRLDGSFIIPPKFSYMSEPVEGSFTYLLKDKWGLMDTTAKELLPAAYHFLHDPGPASPLLIQEQRAHKLSILDMKGQFVTSLILDERNPDYQDFSINALGKLSEGYIPFRHRRLWGFLHLSGKVAIPPQYVEVGDFQEGIARVKTQEGWQYIDSSGQVLHDKTYRDARDVYRGVAVVRPSNEREWVLIRPDGQKVSRLTFMEVQPFYEGKAIARSTKNKENWGIIDTTGNWVLPPEYDKISLEDGLYRLQKERLYGYFNTRLDTIFPVEYAYIGELSEGKVALKVDRRYGFADLSGNMVIEARFDAVQPFQEGLAAFQEKRRWGFINDSGRVVIPPVYQRVKPFREGLAVVALRSDGTSGSLLWGVINREGKLLIPARYKSIAQQGPDVLVCKDSRGRLHYLDRYGIPLNHAEFEESSEYHHGLAKVQINGFEYLLNTQGLPVLNPGYDEIHSWQPPWIMAFTHKRQGLIDRKGREILPAEYEQLHYLRGLYQVVEHAKIGYVNAKGEWVWSLKE